MPTKKALDQNFLDEFEREDDWAEGHGVCQRTVARYRALGLPYLFLGGWIWIHKRGAGEWIASRVKRRNPARRRRQAASAAEISAA
jgi:hypothetical protein